ncbi:Cell wall proline rich protein [Coniochaeta hoffmannii]|uniref:Cell wall proline rich protein n=1 Tax=Coniochaeta hoffmannii TaxID=91930 RepID=A0AA38S455_9PEZI|nr:Cell wall proline rich protein [Coniochaeta hoffmannii]
MGPPSADEGSSSLLSPPVSPMSAESPRTIPSRPAGHGHRRGGSEFVGGSVRAGDAITVLSSSPTKSDSGYASPSLAPATAARRRGHAHKRSGAISSHDLSSIILPPPNKNSAALRGSSAPSTPAVFDRDDNLIFPMTVDGHEQTQSIPAAKSESDIRQASASSALPVEDSPQPPRPANRARVGFSDTLEFIPRPLSLVSNETSSTVTARPGHSTSGSISSLISLANSNAADRDPGSPTRNSPPLTKVESRPSTAGAVLDRDQNLRDTDAPEPSPRRRNSIPHLMQLPPVSLNAVAPSTPSPTKTPKRWSFFGLEPFVGSSSPTRPRPVSAGSSESQTKSTTSGQSDRRQPEVPAEVSDAIPPEQKMAMRKRSKKQKKVKTWAGSILSRKSKTRHVKHRRRTPTPPLRDDDPAELEGRSSVEFLPYPPMVMITEASGQEDGLPSPPPRPASLPDEDTSYPMIDLDAALGPFNTPLPRNPEWEAAQKAGGHVKRQLHSAAGMTRFTGPGMHYQHRRAESAPEMVPFEAGRFGMHRFNSSSTMADVFEEDEEDEEGSDSNKTTGTSTPLAETPMEKSSSPVDIPGVKSTANSLHIEPGSSTGDLAPVPTGMKRKGSDLSEGEKSPDSSRMKSEHGGSSLHDEVIAEEFSFGAPPYATGYDSPSSATPSPRQSMRSKDLAPVDVSPMQLPVSSLAPVSPYSMTQSSSFPSPRTPVSYDTQRISTAPSSFTEDNFRSLLMGEPGPEVRISVDGVPSLTSTSSTMTRESIFMQHPQARQPLPSADQQRPASFTASAFGRRRSSLASLSRLISSSHGERGERSKLSMEVTLDGDNEKKPKASKAKRISRMMQFWRPKEANES